MYTDDSGTITAILQGDRDRYEELVWKYKRMVYGIAWSHLGDRDLSEDIAQETFVTAFRHLGTLRKHDHFPGWLAQIARNVCNTFGRKAQREKALAERWMLESDAAQAQEADRRSLEEQLGDAFAELPAIHREALTVFYLEEKSIRESATVLGISETALKARLHRARIALREQLERRLDETLESLEPSPNFTRKVLSALPLVPNGVWGGGGVLALLGKLIAGLGFMLWMFLVQSAVTSGIMWWFARSEAANIKDTPENRFRKAVLKRFMILTGAMLIVTVAASQMLAVSTDTRTLFRVLAAYNALLLWPAFRGLRVNTNPTMICSAFMVTVFLLATAAIGFLGMPTRFFSIVWLVFMVAAFLTGRNRPTRQDYDLFLRAATGGLGDAPSDEQSLTLRLTAEQLRAFARYLGNEWLVGDYFWQGDAIRVMLSGMGLRVRSVFGLGSSLIISTNGKCTAKVTPGDLKYIRQTTGSTATAEELEAVVCRVVRHALRCFIAGDLDAARSVLTAQSDEAILKNKSGWTPGFIVLALIAIAASVWMVFALH